MHAAFPLILASALVGLGVYGALTRRHVIMLLLSLELVMAGANLALVIMGLAWSGDPIVVSPGVDTAASSMVTGQVFALFTLTIAAAELGVGLAVILLVFNRRGSADLAAWRSVRGGDLPTQDEPALSVPEPPKLVAATADSASGFVGGGEQA